MDRQFVVEEEFLNMVRVEETVDQRYEVVALIVLALTDERAWRR